MSKKHSPTERKALYTAFYQGRDIVEVLNYAVVHGNTYADIKFADGRIHTVPAEEIYTTKKEVDNAE